MLGRAIFLVILCVLIGLVGPAVWDGVTASVQWWQALWTNLDTEYRPTIIYAAVVLIAFIFNG